MQSSKTTKNRGALFLVADPFNSLNLLTELERLPNPPVVLSHSGLFGDPTMADRLRVPLSRIDLRILTSCALLTLDRAADLERAVNAILREMGEPGDLRTMAVPHAFFHAFDATTLVLAALERARAAPGFAADPVARRRAIRDALYRLGGPIDGFVKTYRAPFSPGGPANPGGHEALFAHDLCMSRFDAMGRLRPSRQSVRIPPPQPPRRAP